MPEIRKCTKDTICYQCKSNAGIREIVIGKANATIKFALCTSCMKEITHLFLEHYGESEVNTT